MAKKSNGETTAIAHQQQSMEVSRPGFLPVGDTSGTEHITRDDIQMPRLALAQKISDEVDPTHPKYIDGLQNMDLFNNVSKLIYGPGPLEFMIVRADAPRYIEFIPRNQGGGVRDMNVPPNDPRTQFTKDAQGNSVAPIATQFYDYIVMLLPLSGNPWDNLIALSLKSSNIPQAKLLNTLIRQRNAPVYTGKYKVWTTMTTNKKGTFAIYQVANSDIESESSAVHEGKKLSAWVSEELMVLGKKLHESLKNKTINIDREPGDEDFNTSDM